MNITINAAVDPEGVLTCVIAREGQQATVTFTDEEITLSIPGQPGK